MGPNCRPRLKMDWVNDDCGFKLQRGAVTTKS